MKRFAKLFLIAVLLTPLAAMPARADHGNRHQPGPQGRPYFVHDRHDDGHWVHARRGGRMGWWWVVGPSWSYYPSYPAVAYTPYPVAPVATVPVAVVQPVAPAPFFGLSFNIR